jgi:hypothetical protein
MEKIVTSFFSDEQMKKIKDNIHDIIKDASPYCTSLNNVERRGIRSMATRRDGMARSVSKLAVNYKENLPRIEDPAEMADAIAYFDKIAEVRLAISRLHEMIDDTTLGVAVGIMSLMDRYSSYLQSARTGNFNLDTALNEIDAYNKRFANNKKKSGDKSD